MTAYIGRDLLDEYKRISVAVGVFLQHKAVHVSVNCIFKYHFIGSQPRHKRNAAFKQFRSILFREISHIKDCATDRHSIMFPFAYSRDQGGDIYDVSGNIPEIYGHPVIKAYDINESDFTVYITVLVADLCDVHLRGIWHSSAIHKDSSSSAISIEGRQIFFKKWHWTSPLPSFSRTLLMFSPVRFSCGNARYK